ncbi:MAG: hypothetical protein ACLSW4_04485 [Clostridia bacterium]
MKNIKKSTSKKIKRLDERLSLEKYNDLSTVLKNVKSFLYEFMCFYDNMKVKNDMYPCINNKCYKFIYEDELVNRMRKDKATISKKINILTTLGLIEKLNIYDNIYIHSNINNAVRKAIKDKKKTVLFFYIPNYTHKLLKIANERAIKLCENNFTIKKFNKAFVIKVFGQDFANEVFLDRRTIPKIYYEQIQNIKTILLEYLNKNNIISLNKFKEKKYIKYLGNNSDQFKTTAIDNNINEVINDLLKERIVQKRKLLKKEKELYNIDTKSSKYYILKGENWNYRKN